MKYAFAWVKRSRVFNEGRTEILNEKAPERISDWTTKADLETEYLRIRKLAKRLETSGGRSSADLIVVIGDGGKQICDAARYESLAQVNERRETLASELKELDAKKKRLEEAVCQDLSAEKE